MLIYRFILLQVGYKTDFKMNRNRNNVEVAHAFTFLQPPDMRQVVFATTL